MASISRTPQGRYRVLWRSDGVKRQKNFKTLAEAKRFSALMELSPETLATRITVAALLIEYRDTETPKKRGADKEVLRINRLLQRNFVNKRIVDFTPDDVQRFMEERATEPSHKYPGLISASTIIKEVNTLSAAFSYAVKRGLLTKNPVKGVKKPKEPDHRERVATDEDIEKLMICSGWDGESVPDNLVKLTMAAFLFACRTGMRAGEIMTLEEAWIDGRVIRIAKEATKTDSHRDVALSKEALRILDLVRARGDEPQIFGALSNASRDALWRKVRDRAGLGPVIDSAGRVIKEGLNFHDSRATFATWAASPDPRTGAPRLDVLALARQTGHKNIKMLQRYYRATAADIASRLD